MSWHVPTDREWANLLDKVEGNTTYTVQTGTGWWGTDAGKKMKSAGTFTGTDPGDGSWLDHANRGDNTSGFGAVPAGYRRDNGLYFNGRSINVNYWSSSVGSSGNAWYRYFDCTHARAARYLNPRSLGFSVRCVKD